MSTEEQLEDLVLAKKDDSNTTPKEEDPKKALEVVEQHENIDRDENTSKVETINKIITKPNETDENESTTDEFPLIICEEDEKTIANTKLSELEATEVASPKISRDLKSILELAKEAKLDTNIAHKRKSIEPSKGSESDGGEAPGKKLPPTKIQKLKINEEHDEPEEATDRVNKRKRRDSSTGGTNDEKVPKLDLSKIQENKDAFCWRCHKSGVGISCETCPRSYHHKCVKMSTQTHWQCPECIAILKAENTKTRTAAMKDITLEHLCTLLKFAHKRMMQIGDAEPFLHPVNEKDFTDYKQYIVQPMDLTKLGKNIRANLYGSTTAFEADAKWILHNSIIYNSNQSKLTTTAKAIVKVCKQEMSEIENCPTCYQNANTKTDWFVEVCPKPHLLLWAKLKGFPYWPAKAMSSNNIGMVDVRFFGAHDKAWVSYKDCYLYSYKNPNSSSVKRHDINECIKEVDVYIENLKKSYGVFKYAAYKTPFDPEADNLQFYLPKYTGLEPSKTSPERKLTLSTPEKPSVDSKESEESDDSSEGIKNLKIAHVTGDMNTEVVPNKNGENKLKISDKLMKKLTETEPEPEEKDPLGDIEETWTEGSLPVPPLVPVSKNIEGEESDKRYEENDLLDILYAEDIDGTKLENAKCATVKNKVEKKVDKENKEKNETPNKTKFIENNVDSKLSVEPKKINNKGNSADGSEILTKSIAKILKNNLPDITFFEKENNKVNTSSESNTKVPPDIPKEKKKKQTPNIKDLKEPEVSKPNTKTVSKLGETNHKEKLKDTEKQRPEDLCFVEIKTEPTSDTEESVDQEYMAAKLTLLSALNISEKVDEPAPKQKEIKTRSKSELTINRLKLNNIEAAKESKKYSKKKKSKPKKPLLSAHMTHQMRALKQALSKPKQVNENNAVTVQAKTSAVTTPTTVINTSVMSQQNTNSNFMILPQSIVLPAHQTLAFASNPNPVISLISQPNMPPAPNLTLGTFARIESTGETVLNVENNNPPELNYYNGFLTENSCKALAENLCRAPPKLKPRPPGILSQDFEGEIPSAAGPVTAKINSIAHRVSDYFRGMLIETLNDVGKSDNSEALVANLRLELEAEKHRHNEEILEIKKNVNSILQDIQKSIIEEKEKIVHETRAACEAETIKRVEEAKSKQWCASCSKEAQFYCCWNTSYCDYPCQTKHWPKHMTNCTQNSQTQQNLSFPKGTQPLILRPTAPPKGLTAKSFLGKPTKLIVNKGVNKIPVNFIRTSAPSHLTLVESTPGNYELLGNGPISADSCANINKIINTPGVLDKIKTGNVITVTSTNSPDIQAASTKSPVVQRDNSASEFATEKINETA